MCTHALEQEKRGEGGVNDEITEEIRKYFKLNTNENTVYRILCLAAKAVL